MPSTEVTAAKQKVAMTLAKKAKVKGSCLLWKGHIQPNGYGILKLKLPSDSHRKNYYIHRLSYWVHNQSPMIPKAEEQVSHLCHVKSCFNIQHITLESNKTNNQRKTCLKQKQCHGHQNAKNCLL